MGSRVRGCRASRSLPAEAGSHPNQRTTDHGPRTLANSYRPPVPLSGGIEPLDVAERAIVVFADGAHGHRRSVDGDQQEMTGRRPADGVRFFHARRRARADLAAGARHEIVDPLVARVLKVVLVSAEAGAHAAAFEKRNQLLHPVGVAML